MLEYQCATAFEWITNAEGETLDELTEAITCGNDEHEHRIKDSNG